jgi:hypothetical protein
LEHIEETKKRAYSSFFYVLLVQGTLVRTIVLSLVEEKNQQQQSYA